MEPNTPHLYKPWLHHPDKSSSSLVASGMEIGIPPGSAPPIIALQNRNKALPPVPSLKARDHTSLEDLEPTEAWAQLETKSPFPKRRFSFERVKDLPTPPSPRSIRASNNTSLRSSLSTRSSRKIRQLTGLDLNICTDLPLCDDNDDNDSPRTPDSPTYSTSSGSMYSQPGDYSPVLDLNTRYRAQIYPVPRSPGIFLQSTAYQSQKQVHINRQTPRTLRHTDGSKITKDLRTEQMNRPQNTAEINALHNTQFQELQRLAFGCNLGYSQEVKHKLAHPSVPELEDTGIGIEPLVPKPLAIRSKIQTKQAPSPSKYSIFQSAAEAWSYGINEFTSPSNSSHFPTSDPSRSSGSNTGGSIPVSPMGSMESDHIILPPLPDSPLPPPRKQLRNGKHPLKNPFPFGLKADEEVDRVPSPIGHTLGRLPSGRLKRWKPNGVIPNKARSSDVPDIPIVNRSVFTFTGLPLRQKGGVVEKAKKAIHIRSAEEKRREELKSKIVFVGVTDQSPGMLKSVSESEQVLTASRWTRF